MKIFCFIHRSMAHCFIINFIIAIFATKDTTCSCVKSFATSVVTKWLILGIMKLIQLIKIRGVFGLFHEKKIITFILIVILLTGCSQHNNSPSEENRLSNGIIQETIEDPSISSVNFSNYLIHFYDDTNGWFYGQDPTEPNKFNLFKTSDSGETLIETLPKDEEFYFSFDDGKHISTSSVFFLSPDVFWIARTLQNEVTVFKTNDGGMSWNKGDTWALHTEGLVSDISFTDEYTGWLFVDIKQGLDYSSRECYITKNGGKDWTLVSSYKNQSLPTDHLKGSTKFIDSSNGFMGVYNTAKPMLYQTTDGGISWRLVEVQSVTDDSSSNFHAENFHFFNDEYGIYTVSMVHSDNSLSLVQYVTKDKGANWKLKEGSIPLKTIAGSKVRTKVVSPKWMWVEIGNNKLELYDIESNNHVKTVDLNNITGNEDTSEIIYQFEFLNERVGWVSIYSKTTGEGKLYSTRDGGENWKNIDATQVERASKK